MEVFSLIHLSASRFKSELKSFVNLLRTKTQKIKPHILSLLVSGGDDRLDLDPKTGRNKYHIGFKQYDSLIQRGSCTANAVNPDNLADIEYGYQLLHEKGFSYVRRKQAERIYELLGKDSKETFDLFFAPSGSDLAYVPLLIAQILYESRQITSLTSCPEELGSGTKLAVAGKYFYSKNQKGQKKSKEAPVFSHLKIRSKSFPARTTAGKIIDQQSLLQRALEEESADVKICNLVVGSKSGIEDNLNVIDPELDRVVWTVDLCQLRNPANLIHKLLDRNCLILLTGSKFFQAPPFCGLMLIPKALSKKIEQSSYPVDPGFSQLFAREDLPISWTKVRGSFNSFQNTGLLLRWEAAIGEMERFDQINRKRRNALIRSWYTFVSKQIEKSPLFLPMPDQEQTNSTIVSFRLRYPDETFLSFEELKRLHKSCMYKTGLDFTGSYDRFTMGQPVAYSHGAFIRLAIGAYDIRQLMKNPSWHNDELIFKIITEEIQKLYNEKLSQSFQKGSVAKPNR